jgi:hypothetical protein
VGLELLVVEVGVVLVGLLERGCVSPPLELLVVVPELLGVVDPELLDPEPELVVVVPELLGVDEPELLGVVEPELVVVDPEPEPLPGCCWWLCCGFD